MGSMGRMQIMMRMLIRGWMRMQNLSVLHQNEGGIGKSIPDALKGRGKSPGRREWISQYLPSFGGVQTFSSSLTHPREWIRKSIPLGMDGLTNVKMNPSLPMRECRKLFAVRQVWQNRICNAAHQVRGPGLDICSLCLFLVLKRASWESKFDV